MITYYISYQINKIECISPFLFLLVFRVFKYRTVWPRKESVMLLMCDVVVSRDFLGFF